VAAVVRRQAVVVEIVAWGLMVPLPRRAVVPWCVGDYGLYFCCCCRFYCCSNVLASSSSRITSLLQHERNVQPAAQQGEV